MAQVVVLDPGLFERFGFVIQRGFLPASACSRLRRAMRAAPGVSGEVRVRGRSAQVGGARKVDVVTPPEGLRRRVEAALAGAMGDLGMRFGRKLTGHEPIQYLRYGVGGRYVLHTDRTPGTKDPAVRRRKVSVVVFLGRPGKGPGRYEGGDLVFPAAGRPGLKLAPRPEPGLLIAFPPEVEHEVLPVRSGERHTLAAWLR